MKRYAFLFLLPLASAAVFSQAPADTTLSIQNIEIQGRFAGELNGPEVKRLQIDRNLSSLAGTTAEAFRQLPSLVTDIEGGVFFRGSDRSGMLINGVPYGVLEEYSGDMLIQLPALFFNRLAITSTPPVEWVPDGDAGVLNLSSAFFTRDDSPLQVTLGAGLDERYNAGAVANLHPGKFHIVGKYNYRREYRERSFRKTTTTKSGTTQMNNNATARPDVHLADLTVGYDLSSRDYLSLYGLYHLMAYDRYGGINNTKLSPAGEVLNRMKRHRYNTQRQEAYAAEARWQHTFRNPGDGLSVVFNYNNFGYDEDNDYKNEKPETGKILAQDNLYIRQKKDNYYVSVAYRKQFENDWWLRTGYIGRFKKETYTADANDLKEDRWIPNAQKSDRYAFYRRTHLLYASVEKKWNDLTAEVGVQGEHTWQNVRSERNNRVHFYPRVKLTYPAGPAGRWSLSYMQRAVRPYGIDLNPFVDTSDATHISQGNPDLKDEFIHTVELAYGVRTSRFRVSPGIYYRHKTNRIVDMAYQSGDQTVWKKENVGTSRTVGFELAVEWNPARLLSIGFAGDLYRDEIDGRSIGYKEKKSSVCADVKGNVRIKLTPNTELQLDGFFVSDQLTPQGKIKSRSSVNAGLSHYFFNRKLRANLSINNLFDGLEETTVIDTPAMQMEQVRNRDARVTWLTLTYCL